MDFQYHLSAEVLAFVGLSICAEIVKRHGGTLEFDSETGKGTTVKVFLPKEEME